METLLKRKALWQFTKIVVTHQKDDHHNFVINEKKDEDVGFIKLTSLGIFTFISERSIA